MLTQGVTLGYMGSLVPVRSGGGNWKYEPAGGTLNWRGLAIPGLRVQAHRQATGQSQFNWLGRLNLKTQLQTDVLDGESSINAKVRVK